MKNTLIITLFLIAAKTFGQQADTVNLQPLFGKFEGAFAIYDLKSGKYIQFNPKQCSKRFSPCSTFKIPNSLIGLETSVIKDTSFVIKYDSILHPKDSARLADSFFRHWYEDLSLKNAFIYSCVWYYQELARRVGKERMIQKINLLNYGNNDISSGVDNFWLCGSMQVSIDEQVDFLKRFYQYKLKSFSDKNIDAVKSIMLYESTSNYKLYGKTGSGDCWDNKVIGWYVGFVETKSGTKIFALNVMVNDFGDLANNFRIELTKKILNQLGII